MKLYAAVALFGLAAIKANPIPEGDLFDSADLEDCEDVVEPAELPDIAAPFMDIQAPLSDAEPDCEGEAIEEESILDIAPAFQSDSNPYEFDEECEDEEPAFQEPPAVMKDEPEIAEPPCYDEDESNEPVEEISAGPAGPPLMKDMNPLNEVENSYEEGYDDIDYEGDYY